MKLLIKVDRILTYPDYINMFGIMGLSFFYKMKINADHSFCLMDYSLLYS